MIVIVVHYTPNHVIKTNNKTLGDKNELTNLIYLYSIHNINFYAEYCKKKVQLSLPIAI